ncbi:MAG: agmatinase [Calditrichaeota bacterium]|nr:agmatinase [Calditrichota bacterium]
MQKLSCRAGISSRADFSFIGFPYDEKSSFRRGCALAPAKIRSLFFGRAIHELTAHQIRLGEEASIFDWGDVLRGGSDEEILGHLQQTVERVLEQKSFPLIAGGDHITTVPAVRAVARQFRQVQVIVFDAHPDLYWEFRGDRYSHACVNARLLENDAVKMITILGVREFADEEYEVWKRNPLVKIVPIDRVKREFVDIPSGLPAYVSVDMDVLDPVYAPGVSGWVHRGMSPKRVLRYLLQIRAPLVGMDVVEVNPRTDENDITALLAAEFMAEVAAKVLTERRFQMAS